MKNNICRKRQLFQILRLLQHGDKLLMREIAEHIDATKHITTNIMQNYRSCFNTHANKGGQGSGRGIKRLYSISTEGEEKLSDLIRGYNSKLYLPSVKYPMPKILLLIHSKVFKPYIENEKRRMVNGEYTSTE